jgi:GTP-binding protein YchF
MSLSIGIVGLPNVGKSSTFNALCKAQQAEVANYPFCTIQPNRAVVPVPDGRLEKLAELAKVERAIHAAIEFVDIAGLVKGASRGEGLGNQFLANIRDTAAILHIVRCFDDANVAHVSESIDPRDDIETINLELILADLQLVERKLDRLESAVKGDKKSIPVREMTLALKDHLAQGKPASAFSQKDTEIFAELNRELRLLTARPLIYVANVAEGALMEENEYTRAVREIAEDQGVEMVKICARLEQELVDMSPEERREYLQLVGVEQSGLDQVIAASFKLLGLISFFTMNEQEARAWNIPQGWTAPKAAGAIHTDFERGFIRAEVIPFETFAKYGGGQAVRAAGLMRIEGKEYIVQDGDILYIRFNV